MVSVVPTAMAYSDCVETAKLLTRLTPAERKALLKSLDAKRVRAICECAYNLLRGNISPDKCKLQKLRKYKTALRRLAKRGESWVKKRKYLVQRGSGAAFLIPLLLSTVLQAALNKVVS